jgi:hypothetical protein
MCTFKTLGFINNCKYRVYLSLVWIITECDKKHDSISKHQKCVLRANFHGNHFVQFQLVRKFVMLIICVIFIAVQMHVKTYSSNFKHASTLTELSYFLIIKFLQKRDESTLLRRNRRFPLTRICKSYEINYI